MAEQNDLSIFSQQTREELVETAIDRPTPARVYEILGEAVETDLQKASVEWSKNEMLSREMSIKYWKDAVAGRMKLPPGQEPVSADEMNARYSSFEVIRPLHYNPEFIQSLPSMTRHHILPESVLGWIDKEMPAFNLFLERVLSKMGSLEDGQSLDDLKRLPGIDNGEVVRSKESGPRYDAKFNAVYDLPTNIEGLSLCVYLGQQRIRGVLDKDINQKEIEGLDIE
jgi:hypothetical protein